jgi:hypothetical protein
LRIWLVFLAAVAAAGAQSGAALPIPSAASSAASSDVPPANPKGILALITGSALRYQGEVPDFTCTARITRSEASAKIPPGTPPNWKVRDKLEEVLSFVEGKENHTRILVNGKPTRYTHESLEGMRSDGLLQFVMVPNWIFGPLSQTRFDWVRWDKINGRRMAVFVFETPQSISTHPLVFEERSYMVSYHGVIWADPETGEMARLEAQMEVPKDFPFQRDDFEIDYGMVRISNEEFLLPVKSIGTLRNGKLLSKNEIEFSDYRKYEADVNIQFGDPGQP